MRHLPRYAGHLGNVSWVVICIAFALWNFTSPIFPRETPTEDEPTSESNDSFINYQDHLNKKFVKIIRSKTNFIIIHTSEAGMVSTLRTLSEGKNVGKYRTFGGHANYAISRDGKIYRILNHRCRADHAGLSMWNGLEDISSYSVSIELVGYHYDTITPQQYDAIARLLKILQRIYDIADKNVLTHSQVSYGKPNIWFKRCHRGRKRCALNFDREKAGLTDSWHYDPDVKTGRLAGDPFIYAMFYKKFKGHETDEKPILAANKTRTGKPKGTTIYAKLVQDESKISNIIGTNNTAWNIAGEDFDSPTTLYVLPDQREIRGDAIEPTIGWAHIPRGTRVLLNEPQHPEQDKGPVFLITKDFTAWSFAGAAYCKPSTIYFLSDGRILSGDQIPDWDSIPDGTSLIIGYKGPFMIGTVRGQTPWGIAGKAHNRRDTVYVIPGKGILTGDAIQNFSDIPEGSRLYLKMNESV